MFVGVRVFDAVTVSVAVRVLVFVLVAVRVGVLVFVFVTVRVSEAVRVWVLVHVLVRFDFTLTACTICGIVRTYAPNKSRHTVTMTLLQYIS